MRASTSDSSMATPSFLAPSSTSWNWIRPSSAWRVAPSMSWVGCWPDCWVACWPSWAVVISLRRSVGMPTPLTVAASWLRTPRPPEQPAARTTRHRTGSRRRTANLTRTRRRQWTSIPAGGALGCDNAAMTSYQPADGRYDTMRYRRVGRSGLLLPAISLGLWQNFGGDRPFETQRAIVRRAFDLGITHFDLANNYGPPYGSAEENFGRILATDLRGYRDELVISTKAGYDMWPGPYGDHGSRKYLLASLDQSLARMGLPYVDIFYSHRVDPDTPLEETMGALDTAVRQGKALYAGISSYSAERTRQAAAILRGLGTPLLIHQPSYSMLNRWIEDDGLLDVLAGEGAGCIVFSPLAQGLLTDRYLDGIPEGSRAATPGTIDQGQLNDDTLAKVTALLGASSVAQLEDNVAAMDRLDFGDDELAEIDRHATEAGINLWAASSNA